MSKVSFFFFTLLWHFFSRRDINHRYFFFFIEYRLDYYAAQQSKRGYSLSGPYGFTFSEDGMGAALRYARTCLRQRELRREIIFCRVAEKSPRRKDIAGKSSLAERCKFF
ncbi:MAG: hypothetical protein AABW64_02040 [Nanoarchaeota archaeon]